MAPFLRRIALLLLCVVRSIVASTSTSTIIHQELIDWLRSKQGGFFSDQLAFQPFIPDDPNSPNGIFAQSDIPKGTLLMVLPPSSYITAGPDSTNMCDTTRRLVQEYHKGETSSYAPYVQYVFGQKQHNKLPTAWSKEGLSLLQDIVIGRELPPQIRDTSVSFVEHCFDSSRDDHSNLQTLEDAWRIVISRSWNDVLLPVYDMVNHRNGHYHNMDQVSSAHVGEDVRVVALRDIVKGEQLYISYNECHDADCEGIAYTYVLPAILQDYGFVEQYPRRWNLETPDGEELRFEIGEENEELSLTWLMDDGDDFAPDMMQLNWLRAQLRRLTQLNRTVTTGVQQLEAAYERDTIMDYYDALLEAFQQAILSSEPQIRPERDGNEEQCEVSASGAQTCQTQSTEYDALLPDTEDPLDYNIATCGSPGPIGEYVEIDETVSQYQAVSFEHNLENGDTCLRLSGWLQACTSFRPHYHEAFVHYPARFVKEVKRVIFLGGGDNMILHEILKYPTLELVIGMELDQQVVRSSFKNLGTQPHFDDKRVQWWFGDATKSLKMLPKEYYGTFDLVLVDLQTYVADFLMVTEDLSVMDVAVLLAKPDGVVARNEDFVRRRTTGFAKYTVDLEYHDVPILCQQSITMGSNKIDFLTTKPSPIKVDTVYLKNRPDSDFDGWYNIRTNNNRQCRKSTGADSTEVHLGLFTVLELESTTVPKDSIKKTEKTIENAMKKAGLHRVSASSYKDKDGRSSLVFTLQEGYLVVRMFPNLQYCSLDILLWESYEKQFAVESELLTALTKTSNVQQAEFSLYRIVTGGMYGLPPSKDMNVGPNAVGKVCEASPNETKTATLDRQTTESLLSESTALIQKANPTVVVLCNTAKCSIAQSIRKARKGSNVIELTTCPDLNQKETSLNICGEKLAASLMSESHGKISGIIMDSDVPMEMGQVLLKILENKRIRHKLLEDEYIVVTPTTSFSSWQSTLVERFRIDFGQYSPSYHVYMLVDGMESGVSIFSANDEHFYSHLSSMVSTAETKLNQKLEIRSVQDGIINVVADFQPSQVVKLSDYRLGPSLSQWSSQNPLSHQTIFQFELLPPKIPLSVGERVLVNFEPNVWTGLWSAGKVLRINADGTYGVQFEEYGRRAQDDLERDLIRVLEKDPEAFTVPLSAGQRVLVRSSSIWQQGSIVEETAEGEFEVQLFDSGGNVDTVVRANLVPQMEPPVAQELVKLSTDLLKQVFQNAITAMGMGKVAQLDVNDTVGNGCVMVAYWETGNAVLTWNGRGHVDVNLVTHQESPRARDKLKEVFMTDIPNLVALSRDEQPRGFGRVVNFPSELESVHEELHWSRFV